MAEISLEMLGQMMRQVLDSLRRVEDKLDDQGRRVTSHDLSIAGNHCDFAGQSLRIDKMEARLSRIERRLDLADA